MDDAPPIIGAGVRSRRCTRLRLAPGISAGRPSVLLSRCYVTASALARPLWRLRRYQSFPLLKRVECAGRINAWRSPNELDHLLKLGSAELSDDLLNASLIEQQTAPMTVSDRPELVDTPARHTSTGFLIARARTHANRGRLGLRTSHHLLPQPAEWAEFLRRMSR